MDDECEGVRMGDHARHSVTIQMNISSMDVFRGVTVAPIASTMQMSRTTMLLCAVLALTGLAAVEAIGTRTTCHQCVPGGVRLLQAHRKSRFLVHRSSSSVCDKPSGDAAQLCFVARVRRRGVALAFLWAS